MLMRRIHAIVALTITVPMIGCVALSGADIEATETEEVGTSAEALTCLDQCTTELQDCDYMCEIQYDPYWEEARFRYCQDQCWSEYQLCGYADFRYQAPTYQICHFDPDTHIDGVDVELYTSDTYVDFSCAQNPPRFKKRLLDSVHCGFHSESTCKSRVQTRVINTWLPQGYYPTVTEAEGDLDKCPYPRL